MTTLSIVNIYIYTGLTAITLLFFLIGYAFERQGAAVLTI